MLLILHGARADCHIGEDIGDIAPVFRVEHLVRCGESALLNGTDLHLSHGDQTREKVRFLFGIRLGNHSLVAFSGGAGLVGVDTGDQDQLVLHLLVHLGKSCYIVAHGICIVCGTGTDDDQKFIALAGKDLSDLGVSLFLQRRNGGRDGILFADLGRGG